MKDIYFSFTASPVLNAIKRSILDKSNIKFKEGIIHEDELFNTNLYINVENAVYINKSLYFRRYRENSTMTNKTEEQRNYSFESYITILKEYKVLLEKMNLNYLKTSFIKYRINSVYYNLEKEYAYEVVKKERLNQLTAKEIYFSKTYKNFTRIKKIIIIFKNKLFQKVEK